jgi:hypothetical protein
MTIYFPVPATGPNGDTGMAMSATAFSLSKPCTLNKIWMFSPSGATGLASRVGIWNTSTQTVVSGTDNSSPSWKDPGGGPASAGDGWIYVDYSSSGVTLAVGKYLVSFFNGNGDNIYFDRSNYFFAGANPVGGDTVGGPGWNGISAGGGILTAPNVANGPAGVADRSDGGLTAGEACTGNTFYTGPTAYVPTTTWTYPIRSRSARTGARPGGPTSRSPLSLSRYTSPGC